MRLDLPDSVRRLVRTLLGGAAISAVLLAVGIWALGRLTANSSAAIQLAGDGSAEADQLRSTIAEIRQFTQTLVVLGSIGLLLLPAAILVHRRTRGAQVVCGVLCAVLMAGQIVLTFQWTLRDVLGHPAHGLRGPALTTLLKIPGQDWVILAGQAVLLCTIFRVYRLALKHETYTYLTAQRDVPADPAWDDGMRAVKARQEERATRLGRRP